VSALPSETAALCRGICQLMETLKEPAVPFSAAERSSAQESVLVRVLLCGDYPAQESWYFPGDR